MKTSHQALLLSLFFHAILAGFLIESIRTPNLQIQINSIEVVTEVASQTTHSAEKKMSVAAPVSKPLLAPALTQISVSTSAPLPSATATASDTVSATASSATNSYLALIREKLSQSLHAPHNQGSTELRLVLRLTLLETGALQTSQIDESSGSEELDRLVLEAARHSLPFPPFSLAMGGVHQITLKLPIEIRKR